MQKPNGSFGKKVFAAGLAVSTALWASAGLFVFVAQAVEAHPAGTLVLSGGTVWHISDDGTGRHGFDSAEKFLSHRFDFADVVPANSIDLALPDLGIMPWGSGVVFNDNGTIYQVSGGMKHGFTSGSVYTGLGFGFDDAVPGNLALIPAGAVIDNTAGAHLEGSFVLDSTGTAWYVTATGRMGLSQPGVLFSHGADFGDLVTANASDLNLTNEGLKNFRTGTLVNDGGTIWAVTGVERRGFPSASCYTGFGFNFSMPVAGSTSGLTTGAVYCPDGGTTTPPPTSSTGTLTVSLASDTPASSTIVKNAARVGFTKVNVTATGGDVVIDSMEVERTGISTNSNFQDIILLDMSGGLTIGQAAQVGNEKSLSSTNKATFGDDITVTNGTTKSIMIAANMASTVNNGDTARLQLNSVTVAGTSSVVGALPITGNAMTMNNNVTIAGVTVKALASPGASTQNVGTNDYIVASLQVINDSTEKVELHSLKFTQNGSAGDDDVKDVELLEGGSVIASLAKPANKEVHLVLSSPIVLEKGQTKNYDLRLDIINGSGRTISFEVDAKADVVVRGQTFGFYVLPTYQNSAGTAVTTSPFFNPSDTSIGNGSLTFSKGVMSSLNVSEGASEQALGSFKTTIQGEEIRVTQLVLGVTSTAALTNISDLTIKDANGATIAGPIDPTVSSGFTTMGSATSTDTIIFPVGTNTYTVYGTLNSSFSANDTITVRLSQPSVSTSAAGLVTAKGEVTNQTIFPGPTSDLTLDTVTVKTGGLDVSTSSSPAAQSIIVGANDFIFANFTFDASGSGEDIRLTSLLVPHRVDTALQHTQVINLQLYDGDTALLPIVQPTNVAGATAATSTFSLTSPLVIPKGGSKTLTLKGDLASGSAGNTHAFGLSNSDLVTAIGVSTGNTVTETVSVSEGQTMTVATAGSMTVATDASNPSSGRLLTGGTSAITVGELLISANNEDVDLTGIHFDRTSINGGNLNDEFSRVYLFDGGTQIASVVPTTTDTVTFTNLDGTFVVTKGGGGKRLTVKVDTFNVTNQQGDGNVADAGDGVSFSVAEDKYTAKGIASGTQLAAGSTSGTFTGQEFTVYKSVPTFERVSLGSSTLADGDASVYQFKLTADSKGDIGFYKASFEVATTGATITSWKFYEEYGTSNQVDLTNNGARTATTIGTGGAGEYITVLFDTGTDGVGNGGEFRFIAAGQSKTFTLRGTVTGASTGDSVSTVLRNGTSFGTHPGCAGGATAGNNTCTGVNGDEQGRFVWSDLHYGNSSTTATNTAQWFNGYRVSGLSATSTSQVLSKS